MTGARPLLAGLPGRIVVVILAGLLLFGATLSGSAATKPTTIIVAGSGSGVAIARQLAKRFEALNPAIHVEIPPSIGTRGGVEAAAAGAISLGMVARRLTPAEQAVGLCSIPFAVTAQVMAVFPSVPDDGLTTAELNEIYRGGKTTWRNGRKIIVLTREQAETAILLLTSRIPGFGDAYRESMAGHYWYVLYSDQEMLRTLATTRDALGITDIGQIAAEGYAVKPLKLNGVAPTLENVRNGSYPLVKELAFVYRSDRISPEAERFIAFVKGSEGARILQQFNFLPR